MIKKYGGTATVSSEVEVFCEPTGSSQVPPAAEEYLSAGGRHARPTESRFPFVRQWIEAIVVLVALFSAALFVVTREPSGSAKYYMAAAPTAGATPAKAVAPSRARYSDASSVIGIDAKGRIGSYDTRGNWPRDRGYDTVSQARHLTHIHSAAPNVIGIDAKGRIGRYDARGRWHRYRGYITSSEAENLVHIDRPFISASGRRSSCRVNS